MMTQHPLADALREGPAPLVRPITLHCEGCKHLRTEWWRDYLDNDETDSGTSARCHAIPHGGKTIGVYWSRRTETPSWCPFRDQALSQYEKSDTDRDQLREALTTEEQLAVSEELETLAKGWECSGRYSSNRVSAFYRAALASKTAIDPVTVANTAKQCLAEVLGGHDEYDTQLCCDGRECGCQGSTAFQAIQHFFDQNIETAIRSLGSQS